MKKAHHLLALFSLLPLVPLAHSTPNLVATLSTPTDPIQAASGYVTLTLANTGDSVAHVFSYSTPFFNSNDPRLAGDQFKITPYFPTPDRQFPRVPYSGETVGPLQSQASSFLLLQPGQSMSVTVSLYPDYQIKAGQHLLVTFSMMTGWPPEVFDVGSPADFALETLHEVKSNTLDITVSQKPPGSLARADASEGTSRTLLPGELPPGYPRCTEDQLTALDFASDQASQLARNAYGKSYAYMFAPHGYDPASAQSQLYKNYFGAYALPIGSQMMKTHNDFNSGGLDGRIAMTLRAISIRRSSASYTCGCDDPTGQDRYKLTVATAQQMHPYLVQICPKFWTLQRTGKASQAGTLLHEFSHFMDTFSFNDGRVPYPVPATADHGYYSPAAKRFALQSRDKAASNADNYLYYAIDAAIATQLPGY